MNKLYALKNNYRVFLSYLVSKGAILEEFKKEVVLNPVNLTPVEAVFYDELLDIPINSVVEIKTDIVNYRDFRQVVDVDDNCIIVSSSSGRNIIINNSDVIRVVEYGVSK